MRYISRRMLAEYVAQQLIAGNMSVIEQLAAFLLQTRRTREARWIVCDIESALARQGVIVAHVVSAHPLHDVAKRSLYDLLERTFQSSTIYLDETIESSVLSGIRVMVAQQECDMTARRAIRQLRAIKA